MHFLNRLRESERILVTIIVTGWLLMASSARAQTEYQNLNQATQKLQKVHRKNVARAQTQSRPWTLSTTGKLSRRLLPARPARLILLAANQDKGATHDDEWLLPDPLPKVETTKTPPPPNLFRVDVFMEFDAAPEGASQESLQRGASQIEYAPQLNYSPFTNSTLFVRPTWNTIFSPETSKLTLNTVPGVPTTKVGDTIIGWNQNKIFTWGEAHDGSFNLSGRYYAPTAEADRATGLQAEFNLRGNITQPICSWFTLLFDAKAWWLMQSQTFYVDPNNPSALKSNFDKELTTYFTGVFKMNSVFSFNQSLGVDYSWTLGSYDPGLSAPQGATSLYIDSSIAAKAAKWLEFRIGFNDEPSTNVPQPVQLFGPTDYYYYASVVFSF